MRRSQLDALRAMDLTAWKLRTAASTKPEASVSLANLTPQSSDNAPAEALGDLSWDELAAHVARCDRCPLSATRHSAVFGTGDPAARWLLIGEGPGAEEDRQGLPFVGRAGKLLDAMLAAIGLKRTEVYITNIVKCRPPGNRDPAPSEADACRQYLDEQIARIDPALIIALGRIAAQRLLEVETSLGRLRGKAHRSTSGHDVLATYHPAYLLRNPSAKRAAWEDLQLAMTLASPRKGPSKP